MPSPLTSEFVLEALSGGTCVVRVTSSGFGTGAAWESDFWDDMGPQWMPFFDNLRLYPAHFPGQEASQHLAAGAGRQGLILCAEPAPRPGPRRGRGGAAPVRTCSGLPARSIVGEAGRPVRA